MPQAKCVECALGNAMLERDRHPNPVTEATVEALLKKRLALRPAQYEQRLCHVHYHLGTARYKPPKPVSLQHSRRTVSPKKQLAAVERREKRQPAA